MEFANHPPPGPLASVVRTIWTARGSKAEFDSPEPIVPDGCVEIIFNLADPFTNGGRQPLDLLAGQMTSAVVAVPTGAVDLIGVRFRPGRAGAALRTAMWRLQDQLIEASSVIAGSGRLVDDLRNMPPALRLASLTATLARRFGSAPASAAVERALAIIRARRGNVGIDQLARHLGMTRRHLERRFKDQVGLGVKQMARIARVHAALRLIEQEPLLSGAEIAARCGYSDQSHLIRECKVLTGHTPARLLTSERSLAGLMRGARRSLATHENQDAGEQRQDRHQRGR